MPFPTVLRTIATARIVLPKTIIRLAAGRQTLGEPEQMMCFMAGANAVFTGEQMLTTPCESPALVCVALLTGLRRLRLGRGMAGTTGGAD